MSVHRADVIEAQLFKERARHHHAFDVLFGFLQQIFDRRQAGEHFLSAFTQCGVELAGKQLCQVVIEGTDVFGDRHLVVIEDHQHVGFDIPAVVHCLKGHTGGDRAVADHTDGFAVASLTGSGNRHPDTGTDGGGGVTNTQNIIFTLFTPRESMQPVFMADGVNAVTAPGQDLVRIGLVADIPDQVIKRSLIDIMECHGQFNRAQTGGEMPAGTADAV